MQLKNNRKISKIKNQKKKKKKIERKKLEKNVLLEGVIYSEHGILSNYDQNFSIEKLPLLKE